MVIDDEDPRAPVTFNPAERAMIRQLAVDIVESVRRDEAMPLGLDEFDGAGTWDHARPAFDRREVEHLVFKLAREIETLHRELNTPHTKNFLDAVRIEAAHQRERWGTEHDAGKADADWFWLLGYLAGKAIRPDADAEKKLHHIITTAAACLNWHAHATGTDTAMRPGIEPPTTETE